ncbi:MAG: dihydroneopterin aldolase [Bradymonadales bacterium]|nr:MAG: dihydroneopterin aldolase [Bradymonadales bacterium]
MRYTLKLEALDLKVRLGCSREEQSLPQDLRIQVELHFEKEPKACRTDQISDTICYDEMSKQIAACVAEKPYHLIEHLAWGVFHRLKASLPPTSKICLSVRKLHLPIEFQTGGASFEISELEA